MTTLLSMSLHLLGIPSLPIGIGYDFVVYIFPLQNIHALGLGSLHHAL